MKIINIGVWGHDEPRCYSNLRFNNPHLGHNENSAEKYNYLHKKGKEAGVNFITLDLVKDFSKLDGFMFIDVPRSSNRFVARAFKLKKPMFLITEECEAIYPDNWILNNHRCYEKIFTWNDYFVDNSKYFKINVYFIETKKIKKDFSHKDKLCTLISGNRFVKHPNELYSKRREAVRWFEKNHPYDFDLYGHDWDLYLFTGKFKWINKLNGNKLRFLRKLLGKVLIWNKYPSWRGRVLRKKPILERYKFALCYENTKDMTGYISEKVFDCFFAGTVPIYWGANNITEHIPAECFIDKRQFDSYESLYCFLKGMDNKLYLEYLNNIEAFLNSKVAYQFSSEYFANTVITEILKSMENRNHGN
ncbi:MAG: glycosyltransferase family 10 [Candidatus Omnitrophica bacterium]|nr:glycosyltransferase family 10 [Candidatus Omnitrophota bacterium]